MSSIGVAGLGISFIPSPPRPVRAPLHEEKYTAFSPQQSRRHSLRHTVSYDVDLNRQGWDHERRDGEVMIRDHSSDSDWKKVRISEGKPQVLGHHAHHLLSPLSDVEYTTGSSSDSHGDFSPTSMSSLPSSNGSTSAYTPYNDGQHRRDRLAKSVGAPAHTAADEDDMSEAPQMEALQSRPYPPPIDFIHPEHVYHPSYPLATDFVSPDSISFSPPPQPPSRLPAFLRERTQERGLARPQSMMELGALHARQAALQTTSRPGTMHEGGGASSSAMYRTSTSYSGRGHDADAEDDMRSPESIPSSAGGLQRRHLEQQLADHQSRFEQRQRDEEHRTTQPTQPSNASVHQPQTTFMRSTRKAKEVDGPAHPSDDFGPDGKDANQGTIISRGRGDTTSLSRTNTLLTAGANPARRKKELDRLLAPAKAGKLGNPLPSIGDSPTPSASSSSAAASSSVNPTARSQSSSRATATSSSPVVLEQAKSSSKARVEMDLMLETGLVVEGGELKGRIEVRVRKPKDKGGDVWLGTPKVRVVGFEELTSFEARHIFYHHASAISSIQSPKGPSSPLPCVSPDSNADAEGFKKGVVGQHSVPFSMRLPLGKGAKGAWKGKQGVVRYIVIASMKLKGEKGGDRSIAHFYRHVEIYPYLNPAITLAPSLKPLSATGSKSLFLGGDGEVELTATIHRSTWVAGQRCYVNVNVNNQSTKRIKTLTLTILRTTTVYRPRPYLGTHDTKALSTTEDSACQTQSTKKKVAEATLEVGKKVNKGVTATGSWMGVEAGESGDYSHSLLVPIDALSIVRGRYLDITYELKVSAGGSLSADVSVDLPIKVVNFVSLDPPPGHVGDDQPVAIHSHALAKSWSIDQLRPVATRTDILRKQPLMTRMTSLDSLRLSDLNGGRGPSRMGLSNLSRVNSMDSMRTADLAPSIASAPMERDRAPPSHPGSVEVSRDRGNAVLGRAKERQLQHQMSIDCISSAIASATARRQQSGHQRQESSLREEVMHLEPSSVEPEEWDPEGEDDYGADEPAYYGGGGEQQFLGDFQGFGTFDVGNDLQLDDLDDVPDDAAYLARRSSRPLSPTLQPGPTLDLGGDSEDEIDAMLECSSAFGDDDAGGEQLGAFARRARSASMRSERSERSERSPITSAAPSPNPSISRSPRSPIKATVSDSMPPPLKPKSAMKKPEGFAFATPSSPVRSTATPTAPASPSRRAMPPPTSIPSRPTRGPLPSRPASSGSPVKTHEPYTRTMTRQTSSSSLKRTSAIVVKRPSTRSLRSQASSPNLSHRADPAELDSSSVKASPETQHIRTPDLSSSPHLVSTSAAATAPQSAPRKVRSPNLTSARSVGDLRRTSLAPPVRRNTVVLPSVRNKVAALESRQGVLDKLAASTTQPRASRAMDRANSISSTSDASFALGDLSRANSMMSFQAPMLRRD